MLENHKFSLHTVNEDTLALVNMSSCDLKLTHCRLYTYHVNFIFVLQYPYTDEKGEEQLVFFKQTSTYIAVQTEREVLVDILNSLCNII